MGTDAPASGPNTAESVNANQSPAPHPLVVALLYSLAPLLGFFIGFAMGGAVIGMAGAAGGILLAGLYHARAIGSWVSLYWAIGAAVAALSISWLLGRGPSN